MDRQAAVWTRARSGLLAALGLALLGLLRPIGADARPEAPANPNAGSLEIRSVAGPLGRGTATSDTVGMLIRSAAGHAGRGDIALADADLRRALRADPTDDRPARALDVLYRQSDAAIPIDQAAVDAALEQLGPGFRVSRTRHFVVLSDCDPRWTRSRERLLERAYRAVRRFADRVGVRSHPPEHRMLCVLIDDHDRYEAFARAHDGVTAHWVAGYYASASNRVVFYHDRSSPSVRAAYARLERFEAAIAEGKSRQLEAERAGDADAARAIGEQVRRLAAHADARRLDLDAESERISTAKTVHEAAHLAAFNCGLQSRARTYPFWITEGLATGFETGDPDRPFGPDRAEPHREADIGEAVAAGRVLPLRDFVRVVDASSYDRDSASALYAQAYGVFRYAARTEPQSLGAFLELVAAERPGRIDADRLGELFRMAFGDETAFERSWLAFERDRIRRSAPAGGG